MDGAYGAPPPRLPEAHEDLQALALADSVALDPHKWLYNRSKWLHARARSERAARHTAYPRAYYPVRGTEEAATTSSTGSRTRAAFARSRFGCACSRRGETVYARRIRADIDLARRLHDLAAGDESSRQALSI